MTLEAQVPPAERHRRYLSEGKLAYQEAPDGTPVFPPRYASPGTGERLAWKVSAGRGEVFATTVARPRGAEPYNVALVRLDEGFRMMSRVEGIAPVDVRIGQRVEVRFRDGLAVFVPA